MATFKRPGAGLGYIRTGIDLETQIVPELSVAIQAKKQKGLPAPTFRNTLHTDLDYYWSTDCMIDNGRLDFTTNAEKTYVKWLPRKLSDVIPNASSPTVIRYGIRYSNGKKLFRNPVLVVLIDCDNQSYLRHYSNFIADFFTTDKMIAKLTKLVHEVLFDAQRHPDEYGIKLVTT